MFLEGEVDIKGSGTWVRFFCPWIESKVTSLMLRPRREYESHNQRHNFQSHFFQTGQGNSICIPPSEQQNDRTDRLYHSKISQDHIAESI